MLGPAQDYVGGRELTADRFIRDADARLFSKDIDEARERPHREGEVKAAWPSADEVQQALAKRCGHFRRLARSWGIRQASNALGMVALEPTAHRLLIQAHNRPDLVGAEVLFGGQQDDLGTRAEADVAGRLI
jgi:hypothetical protein